MRSLPRSRAGAGVTTGRPRDSFLDAVKALAIVRVVAWHTWAWPWLSWIGAMPAMFFASGALLDSSLERHGYAATLRTRLRRLLVPFWLYSAAAVAVMLGAGWRPGLREVGPWILPLADPVGSRETPGLWIPLWYLRAYLWFLIGGGLLRAGTQALGRLVLVVPVLTTLGLWLTSRVGTEVPLAVGDAATYSFFVLLGMLYARGASIGGWRAIGTGFGALAVAIGWWVGFGPKSGIVNASYPLVLLVGLATLGFWLAVAPALRALTGPPARLVQLIGSRALTIYLWQGFGLLAADQLVTRHELEGVVGAVVALVVVVTVTGAGAWAFGWVEDLAAKRAPRLPPVKLAPVGAIAVVLLVGAAAIQPASGTAPSLPPSGQAVIARNEFNDEQRAETQVGGALVHREPTENVRTAFDGWLSRHRDELAELGSRRIEAIVILPNREEVQLRWTADPQPADDALVPWWSMSKAVTTAWLAQLVVDGVVALDDPVSKFLPGFPHGDEITLEQLARHQSGIPHEHDSGPFEVNPRDDVHAWMADPELAFEPGTGFSYSRVGYFVLGWALEEATGRSWTDTVHAYSAAAGVRVLVDEEVDPLPENTHPGDGTYHGRLWAGGGLAATRADTARFYRWLLTTGISTEARALMTRFSTDDVAWNYGLGLLPLCPCERDGSRLLTTRYGLDSILGSWAYDETTTATLFLTADKWFHQGPAAIFYALQQDLLDAAAGR